jgi:uncharacterized repeat protein (TIGR03806 family)
MKKALFITIALVFSLGLFFQSCEKEQPVLTPEDIDFTKVPLKNLSEYGFFAGKISDLIPSNSVLLYEPASALFTDYAHKSRFIWMPEGVSAEINLDDTTGVMNFPDKTIIIKNFYYPEDFRNPEGKRRILETRLLVKDNGKWDAFPYLWNDEQTDAVYKVTGGEFAVSWIDENGETVNIDYVMPNKNQCKSCHNINEQMMPIGVKAMHLNHELNYGEETLNQLEKWTQMGYLSNFLGKDKHAAMVNYHDESAPLDRRAMAYLDINCAHCHNAEGPASTSGLFLSYFETEPTKLGIFKTPIAAGFGAGSFKFDIHPGKGDQSIMTYRMESNEVGAAMPEIGRVMTHKEGVQLIKDWINSMDETLYLN